ncbi:MAG: DegV family protein [Clostridiales bacterium]|nr:DegV family protein [Clostridiales bacterium]
MSIKLVIDSGGDLSPAQIEETGAITVPLTLHVDGRDFVDDEHFPLDDFLQAMESSPNVPKSSCPSPGAFAEHYQEGEHIFVITLSANLSGSYASAVAAKDLVDRPERIHVLDSKSACAGGTLLALECARRIREGMAFDALVRHMTEFVAKMQTIFMLGNVDSLMKNGRLSKVTGTLINALNIKPVMGADRNGEIMVLDKVRGVKKTMERMAELIKEHYPGALGTQCTISHVKNEEMALYLKELIEKRCPFKEISVIQTRGLSSLYAVRGGVVTAF